MRVVWKLRHESDFQFWAHGEIHILKYVLLLQSYCLWVTWCDIDQGLSFGLGPSSRQVLSKLHLEIIIISFKSLIASENFHNYPNINHDHHNKYQPKMPLLPIFSSSTHVSSLVNILFESLHFILYVTYSILFLGQNVQKYLDVHHAQPLGTTICFIVEPGSYM